MKHILWILAALLVACGGEFEGDELGQLEEGLTARSGYGVANGPSPNEGAQCNSASDCRFPTNKVVSFSCGSGFSASQKAFCETIVDQEVQALISQFPDWEFGRVSSSADVTINNGNTGGTPTVLDIRAFVTLTHGSCSAALAESPAISGTYRRCNTLTAAVDWAEIDTLFTNAADRIRVKGHTIGLISAASVGIGYTSAVTDRKNSQTITAGTAKLSALRTVDQCRVNNYNPSGDTATTVGGC